MALKKGFCSHCYKKKKKEVFFSVNKDAEICYCPSCMQQLVPNEAIDDYNLYLTHHIMKAKKLLYNDTNFYEAYVHFAKIIEIEEDNEVGHYGRLLSLIYMSTLRISKFKEVMILFQSESNLYHSFKDKLYYLKFLKKINRAVEEYDARYIKRLSFKDYFYSIECIQLYFDRKSEIINLKNLLLNEADYLLEQEEDIKVINFKKDIEKSIKELNKQFKEKVICINGLTYSNIGFSSRGDVLLSSDGKKKFVAIKTFKRILSEKEGRGFLIKDHVYPDNIHLAHLMNVAIPFSIVFLVLALASSSLMIMSQTLFPSYKPLFIYLTIGFGFCLLATMVLHLWWRRKLKKRNHLID